MPIAKLKLDVPAPVVLNLPITAPAPYKGIVADNAYTPLESLITFIDGSVWTVNYYAQVIGSHNDLREQDIGQNAVYQQYAKIVKLEILVTTPLNSSQNTDTGAMVVNGTADVYPPVIPNVGDMFIGDAGDGTEGIFTVTSVARKIWSRDSVFNINYVLVAIVASDPTRYTNLENKVTNTTYFHRDSLLNNKNPLLTASSDNAIKSLNDAWYTLTKDYFRSFFDKEFSTLLIPSQQNPIYDKMATEMVLKLVSNMDANEIRHIRVLNTDNDIYLEQPTVWDMLLNRDPTSISIINKKMGIVSNTAFANNPIIESFRFCGISEIIYPSEPNTLITNLNKLPNNKPINGSTLIGAITDNLNIGTLINNAYVDQNISVPYIHPVLTDDYYVFSNGFYNTGMNMSLIEILANDYINSRAINPVRLLSLYNMYKHWPNLERYYYGIVLMLLIKGTLNNI